MTSRERILDADRRHLWHPYSQMTEYAASSPLVITRAEGSHVYDADGRAYLDGFSSWWVATLGHGHPRLKEALKRQVDALTYASLAGATHEQAALLAEELVAVAPPGLTRVFYSDNGSTAVEIALKLAVHYFAQNGQPQRTRFVALDGGYHGDTLGATSLGAVGVFREPYAPLLFDCVRSPPPEAVGWEGSFEALRVLLEAEGETVAAVVVEPLLQGAAGMRIYPPALLAKLREWTRAAGVLLICDEVFTGFGRTGAMWASMLASVSPDLLCIAKALGGGMLPMAATLTTEGIFEGFLGEKSRAFFHGHSYTGNPLGAAVARETLAIYRDEDVVGQVRAKAPMLRAGLEEIGRSIGVKSGVENGATRTIGLVGAADLGGDGYLARVGWRVADAARRRGAYLRPLGDTVYLCPPLTVPSADLGRMIEILGDSIREVLQSESGSGR